MRNSKKNYLIVDNTKVYFDNYKVTPYVNKSKGIYQVRVDYILQGIVVAKAIEFDLEDLNRV